MFACPFEIEGPKRAQKPSDQLPQGALRRTRFLKLCRRTRCMSAQRASSAAARSTSSATCGLRSGWGRLWRCSCCCASSTTSPAWTGCHPEREPLNKTHKNFILCPTPVEPARLSAPDRLQPTGRGIHCVNTPHGSIGEEAVLLGHGKAQHDASSAPFAVRSAIMRLPPCR